MKPSISVISICFNNLPELVLTCNSVDKQTRLPDEHLIVDGSTNKEIPEWHVINYSLFIFKMMVAPILCFI